MEMESDWKHMRFQPFRVKLNGVASNGRKSKNYGKIYLQNVNDFESSSFKGSFNEASNGSTYSDGRRSDFHYVVHLNRDKKSPVKIKPREPEVNLVKRLPESKLWCVKNNVNDPIHLDTCLSYTKNQQTLPKEEITYPIKQFLYKSKYNQLDRIENRKYEETFNFERTVSSKMYNSTKEIKSEMHHIVDELAKWISCEIVNIRDEMNGISSDLIEDELILLKSHMRSREKVYSEDIGFEDKLRRNSIVKELEDPSELVTLKEKKYLESVKKLSKETSTENLKDLSTQEDTKAKIDDTLKLEKGFNAVSHSKGTDTENLNELLGTDMECEEVLFETSNNILINKNVRTHSDISSKNNPEKFHSNVRMQSDTESIGHNLSPTTIIMPFKIEERNENKKNSSDLSKFLETIIFHSQRRLISRTQAPTFLKNAPKSNYRIFDSKLHFETGLRQNKMKFSSTQNEKLQPKQVEYTDDLNPPPLKEIHSKTLDFTLNPIQASNKEFSIKNKNCLFKGQIDSSNGKIPTTKGLETFQEKSFHRIYQNEQKLRNLFFTNSKENKRTITKDHLKAQAQTELAKKGFFSKKKTNRFVSKSQNTLGLEDLSKTLISE